MCHHAPTEDHSDMVSFELILFRTISEFRGTLFRHSSILNN